MVATPIGNLEDITLRAVKILKEADVIACEDTRHSKKLLSHLGIQARLISCYAAKEAFSAEGIVKLLEQGKSVAYVSDAGTPGLSDPGNLLVSAVRNAGFAVIPVPGPSAFASLVSISGFPGRTVIFDGFPSPKQGKRKKRIKELGETGEQFLFYESPHRIVKLLTDIAEILPDRQILVGREMTKMYEEYIEGSTEEVRDIFASRKKLQGEFSVLVSPQKKR